MESRAAPPHYTHEALTPRPPSPSRLAVRLAGPRRRPSSTGDATLQVAFLPTDRIFLLSDRGARNISRLAYPHRPSFTEAAEALLSAYLMPLDLPLCTASTWKYGGGGNKLFGGFLHQAISPVFGVWLAWTSGCRFLPQLLVCH